MLVLVHVGVGVGVGVVVSVGTLTTQKMVRCIGPMTTTPIGLPECMLSSLFLKKKKFLQIVIIAVENCLVSRSWSIINIVSVLV